ncbi:MAG: adenylate/guanylate cyclase domain-containing protein [Spirochaetia bacterium]|jgi:adenylate cyclase|nr:adenylate/guanylate cyclase domain-containing protein [Spirochaetia bacterium]
MKKAARRMDSSMNKAIYRSFLALLVGLAGTALLLFSGLSRGLDRELYDFRAALGAQGSRKTGGGSADRADSAQSSPVELVFVDQYSLAWVEENLGFGWPWPRELYGILAEYCSQARVTAFDILFTETSSFGPDDDLRCARAMDRAGNVVLAGKPDRGSLQRLSALPVENVRFGSVSALLDEDGVVRRYRAGSLDEPSFGLAVLLAGGQTEGLPELPEAFLRFSGPSPGLPARNAAEILYSALSLKEGGEPVIKPEHFKDRYMIFGFSAPGLLDRQAVPTDAAMPGAEIHGTFINNVLNGQLLYSLYPIWEILIVLALAAAAALCASYFKRPAALVGAAALLLLAPLAAASLFYEAGLVSMPGVELAALSISFMAGIVLSYVAEGRNKAFLKRSFSQYLSPDVIEELSKNPELLKLGGEERTISVFFSDIEGFTALSESLSPERLAFFMNRYLSILSERILSEGGTLDKYVGDAVVAFWNAPLGQEDHAIRALRAALRCQEALYASTPEFNALGFPLPRTRIGIHTGTAIVGNMGSQWRFNYTALGDVVNTASRLEGANKLIGTSLLVSGDTVVQARSSEEFSFRRLGELLLQGKSRPVEVWDVRFAKAAGRVHENPGSGSTPGAGLSVSLGGSIVAAWEGVRDCRG